MKNCIYEPVFGLFLLFNFQIDSALTFSSRLNKSNKLCPKIEQDIYLKQLINRNLFVFSHQYIKSYIRIIIKNH